MNYLRAHLAQHTNRAEKRPAESQHPDESSGKRQAVDAQLQQDLAAAAGDDSDDEFVDAAEDLASSQPTTQTSGKFKEREYYTGPNDDFTNYEDLFDRPLDDGGDHPTFENQFGGLDEEELGEDGIPADIHANFLETFEENERNLQQHLSIQQSDEMPSREVWNEMSETDQDALLAQAAGQAHTKQEQYFPVPNYENHTLSRPGDETVFGGYVQQLDSSSHFSNPLQDTQAQPTRAIAVNEHPPMSAMSFGGQTHPAETIDLDSDSDAELGATRDESEKEDGEDLFTTAFGKDSHDHDSEDEKDDATSTEGQGQRPKTSMKRLPPPTSHRQAPAVQEIDSDNEAEVISSNKSAIAEHLNAIGFIYVDEETDPARPTTPPLPSSAPALINGVNKTSASTAAERNAQLQLNAQTPTIPRDLSPHLKGWHRFSSHAYHLIPRLPNYNPLEPRRRYWIAVLLMGKNPFNKNLSEKDFMWMKGNKYSTVSTIWHSFQLRSMCDPDDLVLTGFKGEILGFETQAQECDWFDQNFVCLRAMGKRIAKGNDKGFGNGIAVVPRISGEVIELD